MHGGYKAWAKARWATPIPKAKEKGKAKAKARKEKTAGRTTRPWRKEAKENLGVEKEKTPDKTRGPIREQQELATQTGLGTAEGIIQGRLSVAVAV